MKVYVMTEADLFGVERYVGVKASKKAAEKEFRKKYPHMKKDEGNDSYVSASSGEIKLLFVHEEEI